MEDEHAKARTSNVNGDNHHHHLYPPIGFYGIQSEKHSRNSIRFSPILSVRIPPERELVIKTHRSGTPSNIFSG